MPSPFVSQLADEWIASGIHSGDLLLVHSNISRHLRWAIKQGIEDAPKRIIESLLEAVGSSGTLLFPTFNFDFSSGTPFDVRNSASQMGLLTETARKWPSAIRTGHPIYSFVSIGKESQMFSGLKNFSGYGADSPFALLHQNGGKIGVIDLPDQHSMTFYHYVEEALSVPYRFHKKFTGKYVCENGIEKIETFGLFVRKLEMGVTTFVDPMENILWEKGLYTGKRPFEGSGFRVIDAQALYSEVEEVIKTGSAEGILYKIEKP